MLYTDMTVRRILTDGLIACIPFTIVVWTTFLARPRLWLHSLPADIQSMVAPKSAAERRTTVPVGAVVLLCFFGVPSFLTWRLHSAVPGGLSFRDSLTHLWGVWMIVNVWDLVAMDWPYAYFMDPSRPPIPGTAGASGYKDYGFHFRAFLKASLFGLGVVVPVAIVISLLPGG